MLQQLGISEPPLLPLAVSHAVELRTLGVELLFVILPGVDLVQDFEPDFSLPTFDLGDLVLDFSAGAE